MDQKDSQHSCYPQRREPGAQVCILSDYTWKETPRLEVSSVKSEQMTRLRHVALLGRPDPSTLEV